MNNPPLTIVFCLPGNSFSGRFLECWTNLLAWCLANGIRPILSRKYSNNIYFSRTMCLGGDVMRGQNQKPFNGKIDYDYIMWIDSDILFTPQQFARLLSHNVNIVSGVYLMEGGEALATVKDWDEEFFKKHGHFEFMTLADIEKDSEERLSKQSAEKDKQTDCSSNPQSEIHNPQLIEVDYTGMGFMLVRKGVFESLEYPWFRAIEKRIGNMVDFTTEDVAFCLRAKENGFRIHIDTNVKLGHQKTIIL